VNADRARDLLDQAADEPKRLRRHLLVAAALRELLEVEPIVVGGTAEEFWTRDEYHPTDLDVVLPFGRDEERRLRDAGFRREGRHWTTDRIPIAIEIPDSALDGDPARTHLESVGVGAARIIGVDDLYLDRLRQATMNERAEGVEYHSALAVMSARYEDLDRRYIRARLADIAHRQPRLAETMRRIHRRIGTRVRRLLTTTDGDASGRG